MSRWGGILLSAPSPKKELKGSPTVALGGYLMDYGDTFGVFEAGIRHQKLDIQWHILTSGTEMV
jgi:hypothetical protein